MTSTTANRTHSRINELTEEIKIRSEPFRRLLDEVGRVIVGQQQLMHRMLIGLAGQRAPVDRRCAGTGQDDGRRLPGQRN